MERPRRPGIESKDGSQRERGGHGYLGLTSFEPGTSGRDGFEGGAAMAETTLDDEFLRGLLEREGTDLESFNEEKRLYREGSESDASFVQLAVDEVTAPTGQTLVDTTPSISNPAAEQLRRITVRLEFYPSTGEVWNVGEKAGVRAQVTNTTGAPLRNVRI
jgi:hypothetical protein